VRLRTLIATACVATAFVAVVLALALAGHSGTTAARDAHGTPLDLAGTTLADRHFDLRTLRGRRVVINFFAQWCPPCNAEAPDLAAFARAHPDVAFVGVDVHDKVAAGRSFVREYGLSYPVVSDPTGAIAAAWGVTGIPTTFFVDGGGLERAVSVGATTRQTFEEKLKEVP
jgi:thiol-disulfide isomerase/thioredoxin